MSWNILYPTNGATSAKLVTKTVSVGYTATSLKLRVNRNPVPKGLGGIVLNSCITRVGSIGPLGTTALVNTPGFLILVMPIVLVDVVTEISITAGVVHPGPLNSTQSPLT